MNLDTERIDHAALALPLLVGIAFRPARASAFALALAASALASAATAEGGSLVDLWAQNDSDIGTATLSQNFEPDLDAWDCQAADDFVVPKGETWSIKQVEVSGWYWGNGIAAKSENVVFYRNAGGLPGREVGRYTELVGADPHHWGAFVIDLPRSMKLGPGRYWISVQANIDWNVTATTWGWESRAPKRGRAAAWVNPLDGFESGCTSYEVESTCLDGGAGSDHMFVLRGTRKGS